MSTNNITKRGIDLAYLTFMLLDAQTGIAAMLHGQTRHQVKQTFNRLWQEMRFLQKILGLAATDLEQQNRLAQGEFEDEIAKEGEFFILCAEAKLHADRTGKTAQLVAIIKTFRENIKE